ncbi:hypothetical protein F383_25538 [Gossypium arboreum]|uniref:Uncharacterized protein n=1 Tax=Gossypium arboreum TaxID=29729 RepID=A0A0B0P083_GOSAR|nr:hypothetical protein F383_25538 [Gossypium arboreum]
MSLYNQVYIHLYTQAHESNITYIHTLIILSNIHNLLYTYSSIISKIFIIIYSKD